jgi:hypothetical protein
MLLNGGMRMTCGELEQAPSVSFVGLGRTRDHLSRDSHYHWRDSTREYIEYEAETMTFRSKYCYNVKLRKKKRLARYVAQT